jgi:Lon protease-like protein
MGSQTINVPLFPLPDTVLFPHTLLPLHVFEPRYKAMIADVLASEQMIGVVQLRPGWDDDYFGSPPIYKVFGIGRIIESERWPDGRYDVLVSGLYRAQLVQEVEHDVYRQAEVEIINDYIPADKAREVSDVHTILLEILKKFSSALPPDLKIYAGDDLESLSPGMLTDVMASLLVNDPYDRQSLLSEPNVARRQQLLRIQIQAMLNPGIPED